MKKQLLVWRLISCSLQENVPVMLLYVVESAGSSPGRAGFCMAVNARGEMEGSIGGGIMEHKFVEMAKEKLRQNEYSNSIYKQVHDKVSSQFQSGMICSGEQTNFVYKVKREDIKAVGAIVDCFEASQMGKLRLSPEGIEFSKGYCEEIAEFLHEDEHENDWFYEEKLGFENNLYIIGGGHCSLALSEFMSKMNVCIHVYEDRMNLPTFLHNNFAYKKSVISNYSQLKDLIPSSDNNFIIVMTMGYRTDDIVIRALIQKEFKYFGVLGSKKKVEKMLQDYRAEGFTDELLKKLHAPIGIQINSQTPEEIAISIAAEIIAVKNGAAITLK